MPPDENEETQEEKRVQLKEHFDANGDMNLILDLQKQTYFSQRTEINNGK